MYNFQPNPNTTPISALSDYLGRQGPMPHMNPGVPSPGGAGLSNLAPTGLQQQQAHGMSPQVQALLRQYLANHAMQNSLGQNSGQMMMPQGAMLGGGQMQLQNDLGTYGALVNTQNALAHYPGMPGTPQGAAGQPMMPSAPMGPMVAAANALPGAGTPQPAMAMPPQRAVQQAQPTWGMPQPYAPRGGVAGLANYYAR